MQLSSRLTNLLPFINIFIYKMNYNIRAQYKKAEYYTVASNKNTTEEAKLLKYKLFSFYFFSIFLFSFQNKTRFYFSFNIIYQTKQ